MVDDADAFDVRGVLRDGYRLRTPLVPVTVGQNSTANSSVGGVGIPARIRVSPVRLSINDAPGRRPIAPIDDGVLEDGESVKVEMTAMDAVVRIRPTRVVKLVDAYGNAAGRAPGYIFAAPGDGNSELRRLHDATEIARSELTRQRAEAWRGPVPTFIAEPPLPAPKIAPQRSGVSSGYVRASPPPRVSTASVSPSSEATDADQARDERHRRDLDRWRDA